jgi:hypothetical protein
MIRGVDANVAVNSIRAALDEGYFKALDGKLKSCDLRKLPDVITTDELQC